MAVIQGIIISKPNVRNVTWTKDTVPIAFSNNIKYQISGSLTNPELKIDNVQEADKGTYSCAAYNGFDTGTDTVVIFVGGNYMYEEMSSPLQLYALSYSH